MSVVACTFPIDVHERVASSYPSNLTFCKEMSNETRFPCVTREMWKHLDTVLIGIGVIFRRITHTAISYAVKILQRVSIYYFVKDWRRVFLEMHGICKWSAWCLFIWMFLCCGVDVHWSEFTGSADSSQFIEILKKGWGPVYLLYIFTWHREMRNNCAPKNPLLGTRYRGNMYSNWFSKCCFHI